MIPRRRRRATNAVNRRAAIPGVQIRGRRSAPGSSRSPDIVTLGRSPNGRRRELLRAVDLLLRLLDVLAGELVEPGPRDEAFAEERQNELHEGGAGLAFRDTAFDGRAK